MAPSPKMQLTWFHTWGFIVPLLSALSPMWLPTIKGVHVAVNALIGGIIVAALAYMAMTMIPFLKESEHALSKAVLCGLLVAEVLVLKSKTGSVPTMAAITLWLFFYYHTVEHP
jgi:hypothetical protein